MMKVKKSLEAMIKVLENEIMQVRCIQAEISIKGDGHLCYYPNIIGEFDIR